MNKKDFFAKESKTKSLLLSLLFSLVLIIWFLLICTQNNTAYDNAYQYFLNLHSWKDMFDFILVDYSPPLYSVVLKLYTSIFGTSLVAYRTLSLILLCSMFFLSFFPIRRIFGKACSYLTAVLFLTSSYNFYFGVAIRPTVLAYTLTTAMFVYAISSYMEGKISELIKFSVCSILCMYTHNISLIAAFCIYATTIILALIRKNMDAFKKFLISGISVAVLFIPWLIVLLTQMGKASDHFWSCQENWSYAIYLSFIGFVSNLKQTTLALPVMLFIFALPLINVLVFIKKDKLKEARSVLDLFEVKDFKNGWQNTKKLLYLFLLVFVSVNAFYLVTEFIMPIFARRYFYIFSGAGIILLSGLATLCKNKKIPAVILSVLCLFTFGYNTIAERQIINMNDRERMIADINAMTNGKPEFIDFFEETLGVSTYYFPNAEHYVSDATFTVLPDFEVFGCDTTYINSGDNLWDHTDELYIFSAMDFEIFGIDPIEYYYEYFRNPEEITIEEVDVYILPYTNEIGYGVFDITLYRVTKN